MLWCSATQYRVNPSRSAVCASRTVAASASPVVWSVRTGTRSRTESRIASSTIRPPYLLPGGQEPKRPGNWQSSPAQTGPLGGIGEDVVEHGRGEPPGEHVLLAGVIAAQQLSARRQLDDHP